MPSKAAYFLLHEGDRAIYEREDGRSIEIPMTTRVYKAKIDNETAFGGGLNAVKEIVWKLTQQITQDMTQKMSADLASGCEEVGNVVNLGGRPITPEVILEAYEMIETGFDSNGEWLRPNDLDGPPALQAEIRRQISRIDEEPDLRRRLDEIIAVKRAKWRAREANRKLVD